MKRINRIIRFVVPLLGLSQFMFAAVTTFLGAEHTVTGEFGLAWSAAENAEFYELKAIWMDVTPNIEYDLGRTSDLTIRVNLPRSGHFVCTIRSGRWDEDSQQEVYSEWGYSTDAEHSKVNDINMAWRVRKVLGSPEW